MTKIDIISGFLGAGKTTVIKKLLAGPLQGQQVVLIENEFGEIGIDGGFLKEAGIEIREMNSGCICCSLVGDFETALAEVIEKYQPERIIIEPSGVGKLSDVIGAVQSIKGNIQLNSATTVVDVTKCKMHNKNFGEFYKNQVEAASTIILSRMDTEKATEEKVQESLGILGELNPKATIITTPVEQLEGKKLLDTMEGIKIELENLEQDHGHGDNCSCGCHEHSHAHHHDHTHAGDCDCDCHEHNHAHHHDHTHDTNCNCGCHEHGHEQGHVHHEHDHTHADNCSCGCHEHNHDHHHEHHAEEVFTSWGITTTKKFTETEMREILDSLADEATYGVVLRAKGMVESSNREWIYFDMVPEEVEIRKGSPEYTGRICVIGAKLQEDKLQEVFGR